MILRIRLITEDVTFDDIDIDLTPDSQVLGRSMHSDVQVVHPLISRQHCQFLSVGSDVILRDLNSTNQTIVNGKPIEESALESGDRLLLGELEFLVEISPAEENPRNSVNQIPRKNSPNNSEMPTTRLKSQAVSAGGSEFPDGE